jgi:hypothetical protein
MKTSLIAASALLAFASIANAQQPLVAKTERTVSSVPQQPSAVLQQTAAAAPAQFVTPNLSAPTVTPELWVYAQELRRHEDPAQAVRRKAELKAEQRMARLAAMHWYGFSNSPPVATPTPFMGEYSPAWVGNGWNRYDWVAASSPGAVLHVDSYSVLR